MNAKTNENVIVREYEFDNPFTQKIDSLVDNSIRDCHNKYFHTNISECIYDIKLTNITNKEIFNLTIMGKP